MLRLDLIPIGLGRQFGRAPLPSPDAKLHNLPVILGRFIGQSYAFVGLVVLLSGPRACNTLTEILALSHSEIDIMHSRHIDRTTDIRDRFPTANAVADLFLKVRC